MTTDLHPFPFAGRGPVPRRRWPEPAALTAATLCAASFAYTTAMTVTGGWPATTKAWFAWPTYTTLNIGAMLAALAAAWLSRRELRCRSGNWTALNVAVFAVSALLCLAFILSLAIAAVIAFLNASDDESNGHMRPRSGRRRRSRPRSRNRRSSARCNVQRGC